MHWYSLTETSIFVVVNCAPGLVSVIAFFPDCLQSEVAAHYFNIFLCFSLYYYSAEVSYY